VSSGHDWYVRAFYEGDEPAIYALWKAVYGDRISGYDRWLRRWRWMYRQNPRGHGCVQLAVHNDSIVGQYSAIPIRVKVEEEVMTAGLGTDLMTHPDYRLQGILENVCAALHQEAGERGLSFVYGFPSHNARPGIIRKLHYSDVASPHVMIRPINWEKMLRPRIRSGTLRKLAGFGGTIFSPVVFRSKSSLATGGITVTRVDSFDERVNRLWERISPRFACCLVKDRDYLNWRYTGLDDRSRISIAEASGEMAGYMVIRETVRNGVRIAYVYDLASESDHASRCLVQEAVDYLRVRDVDVLSYQLFAKKSHRRMIAGGGFVNAPFVRGPLSTVCLKMTSQETVATSSLAQKEWFFQLGDSDMFSGYNG